MNYLDEAVKAITALQGKERTPVWMVGEQLKDMIREHPEWAELVAADLKVKEMDLAACEKKIKEYADKHKTGMFACVTPVEAEEIICKFYGLKNDGRGVGDAAPYSGAPGSSLPTGKIVELGNFF